MGRRVKRGSPSKMWYLPQRVADEALPFHLLPNSFPSCDGSGWLSFLLWQNKLGFLRWGARFLLGCARNPQIPPASLYQHTLATKTTPKPKHIPSPSKTASGTVNATAGSAPLTGLSDLFDFLVVWSFPHHSTEGNSSPSYQLQCIIDMGIASILHCWYSGDLSTWYGNKENDINI